MTACQSLPSVINSRPTTVACRSHSASHFKHSMMTSGCDAMCRVISWCQPRLVEDGTNWSSSPKCTS